MPAPVTVARPLPRFLTASLAHELGILLVLSVMFPFLMHLLPVPETTRLGARLLPMFYAPLLAALWGRKQTGWLVALLAPWLNWALTGHPAPLGAIVMMIQLLVFVVVVPPLLTVKFARWFVAGPAYVAGMAASLVAALIFPDLIGGRPPFTWVVNSVVFGLPGVAALVVITALVLKYYPPAGKGGGPVAA